MSHISQIVPRTPLELERFYLDTITKLQGTDTTLADEDLKSAIPFISMVHSSNKRIDALEKTIRTSRAMVQKLERVQHENRVLKAQLSQIEKRVTAIEKEIP